MELTTKTIVQIACVCSQTLDLRVYAGFVDFKGKFFEFLNYTNDKIMVMFILVLSLVVSTSVSYNPIQCTIIVLQ